MAWTAPQTFTAGSFLLHSDLNTYLQNNMKESLAEKATASHQFAVVSAANSLVARTANTNRLDTSETTTSTTYTDLPLGANPVVSSVTTGTSVLVIVTAALRASSTAEEARMSVAVSGSTTLAATDNYCLRSTDNVTNHYIQASYAVVLSVTAGTNTFTAKYRSSIGSSTATFVYRNIIVIPF